MAEGPPEVLVTFVLSHPPFLPGSLLTLGLPSAGECRLAGALKLKLLVPVQSEFLSRVDSELVGVDSLQDAAVLPLLAGCVLQSIRVLVVVGEIEVLVSARA
jgi:hypothetical protein